MITSGTGIGWRPELALAIDRDRAFSFVEITAENHPDLARLPAHLHQLRERGVAIIPHGISLSLGGAERINVQTVKHLGALAREFNSPLVSEHIAFVRAGGREAGHLLPVPRTKASLAVLVENVKAAQDLLEVPLALENISALFDWPCDQREIEEAEFIECLLDQTGAMLLLDVANVFANTRNLGGDPIAFLTRMSKLHLAYIHMGGGYESADGIYHDTHAHDVPQGAIDLLEELAAFSPPPGVMLERDDHFPDQASLATELKRIRDALNRGAARLRLAGDCRSPLA